METIIVGAIIILAAAYAVYRLIAKPSCGCGSSCHCEGGGKKQKHSRSQHDCNCGK